MIRKFSRHIESIKTLKVRMPAALHCRCRYCRAGLRDFHDNVPFAAGQERPVECPHCGQRYFLQILGPGLVQRWVTAIAQAISRIQARRGRN